MSTERSTYVWREIETRAGVFTETGLNLSERKNRGTEYQRQGRVLTPGTTSALVSLVSIATFETGDRS